MENRRRVPHQCSYKLFIPTTIEISVAAHLRGMRLTLTAKKDPLMLRRNSNILLLLLNFHYNCIMYFNCCAHIRIRIYIYVSLTMHINMGTYLYGTKLIRTRTEPLRNKRVFTEHYLWKRCYIYINIII